MTPTQTTIQNYQTNISNFDFTTLSVNAQNEILALFKGMLTTIQNDTLSNTTDPTQIFTTLTTTLKNNITPPQQVIS